VPQNPNSPLLGAAALAIELDCTETTIYRKARSGEIPGYRLGPRGAWRFDLNEVRAALAVQAIA
jgi:excisionase family DNA binding protein